MRQIEDEIHQQDLKTMQLDNNIRDMAVQANELLRELRLQDYDKSRKSYTPGKYSKGKLVQLEEDGEFLHSLDFKQDVNQLVLDLMLQF